MEQAINWYAGIGSSKEDAPEDIQILIKRIAKILALSGYGLRSGGANKADTLFESGADDGYGWAKIYLPWNCFNKKRESVINYYCGTTKYILDASKFQNKSKALEFNKKYHPIGDKLNHSHAKLMARNAHQVLGDSLEEPCKFIICWTSKFKLNDKKEIISVSGGTGQAIRIAIDNNIPIYHLGYAPHRDLLEKRIAILEDEIKLKQSKEPKNALEKMAEKAKEAVRGRRTFAGN